MRRLIESLTPGERPISWTWIGGMFAFYVVVTAAAVTLLVGHPTRANLVQKTGATVATGAASSSAGEPGMLRSLQHVVHYRDDARVIGSE
ncbi:hypothetical protein [Bradyrhizobium sp.]|uniref:hypothetical protein n=1 Tax=Bradyrhizobium sp. TaxID=376 RepID=UPI001DBDBC7F|nr:hypothetical protein [Bradyrhizobium sp.]MBI5318529.1 hypothetical protein [Bradyrhizobium sp.]